MEECKHLMLCLRSEELARERSHGPTANVGMEPTLNSKVLIALALETVEYGRNFRDAYTSKGDEPIITPCCNTGLVLIVTSLILLIW